MIWILVIGLQLSAFKTFSQKVWSLDDCIAYALKHNLTQEAQNYNAEISKERWLQSKRDMLPTIGISYPSYNVSLGRSLDPVTNSFIDTRYVSGLSGGLSSSITVFESFKKWHALAYSKLLYQSSKFREQQAEYDLAFKIMGLFNTVLFQEGALDIIKEQQAVNFLYQKEISKKVALELVAKADLYAIEATISADALAVLKAKNALNAAKLALIQEMNLEAVTINIIQDAPSNLNVSSVPLNIDHLFNTSKKALPNLQISQLNIETAKKELAMSKTARYPSIRFGANMFTSYSDNFKDATGSTIIFKDQIKNNLSKSFGFSLNYALFNNGRTRSSIKIARIQLEKAKTQLEIEEQRTYKVIQELLQKNEALIAEKELTQKNIKAKEKAYDIAKRKFEKKLINLYELEIASNAYLNTKIEQVRLMAQMAIQKRTLDFYNGTFKLPIKSTSN
ncbi:TolC family protein [Thalassobellus citreus]|uniref:TolC family protein n=1 Tax=Thalassobellus citreus TaxID=3367752 RepID=UPI0037B76D8F